jgi:predicted nucleic acid-binding protein
MILVDTSVWIGHLRTADKRLVELIDDGMVLGHPFVTGELALGKLPQRDLVLGTMKDLPQADVATDDEVQLFIDRHALFGFGIGYVDAHLLAAVRLTQASLWTRDRRVRGVAERLGLAARLLR